MIKQFTKNILAVKKQSLKRPLVSGKVIDRFLFNFRVNLNTLQKQMPSLKWLEPRNANGYGVISLCIIDFKGLTIRPFPILGVSTVACAYRYSVMDVSGNEAVPSVYLLGRNTGSSFANCFGPLILSSKLGKTKSTIKKDTKGDLNIDIKFPDGHSVFSATILQSKPQKRSVLFGSTKKFKDFMSDGLVSYTPGLDAGRYARCDFEGEAFNYEQVDAKVYRDSLTDGWGDANVAFDSAYRTVNVKEYNLRNMGVYNGSL